MENFVKNEDDFESQDFVFVPRKRWQFFATAVVSIGSFGLGVTLGWSAPALPDLVNDTKFGSLTSTETSWIASLVVLGSLFCGLAGFSINIFGCRKTMLLFTLPNLIGWICISSAHNIWMIYIGRFLTGFASSSFTVTIPIYVSEISQQSLKETLGSSMVLSIVCGILFSLTVGGFGWFWLSICAGLIPLLLLIGLWIIPESPRYHLVRGDVKNATKSLLWLRGAKESRFIQSELNEIQCSIDNCNGGIKVTWRDLFEPSVLKPLFICLGLMFFQQFSGINGIMCYTVDIFQWAGSSINPNLASILVGIVQVIFVLFSIFLIHKFGRRFILIISFFMMSASLSALGAFFYLKFVNFGIPPANLSFLPLLSLIIFIISYSFGLGPLPWIYMNDVLPMHIRGYCAVIVTSFYWVSAFISTKSFEDIGGLLGWHGCIWLYASICFAGLIFTLTLVPETKGKSPCEIAGLFSKNPPKDCQKLCYNPRKMSLAQNFIEEIQIIRDKNANEEKRSSIVVLQPNSMSNNNSSIGNCKNIIKSKESEFLLSQSQPYPPIAER